MQITDEQINHLYESEMQRIMEIADDSVFGEHLWNYYQFVSWARWFPDRYVELFKTSDSNMQLHFDQRVFMRCDVRFQSMYGTFSRGYAKCVTGDTLLFTKDGVKEIGEYFDYNQSGIETHYPTKISLINRHGKLEETKLGLYNGKQKTLKLTTNDGFEINGTHIHKILVMDECGKIKFKKLKDIKIGDYVIINRNNDMWGNIINIDVNKFENALTQLSPQIKSHLHIRKMPTLLTQDISLLLGYLVGDGCLTQEKNIIFTNKDESIINKYKQIMKNIFDVKNIRQTTDVDYVITDKYLKMYLSSLGLYEVKSYEKEIPKVILNTSKENVSSFLRGLFDTDGTVDNKVVSLCTVSHKLAKQVQFLLLNFGIISRLKQFKTKSKFGICYKVIISGSDLDLFKKYIGFDISYKKEKLDDITSNINRNTNKDIIPSQRDNISYIYEYLRDKKVNVKFLYHVYKNNNNLTYKALNKLLNLKEHIPFDISYLEELKNNNYYYSKVEKIENEIHDVYDFHLPLTHSFVSNGIVSHNTYTEVLDDVIVATLTPNITLSVTAQTRENSAALLQDKMTEILQHYPLLENEIEVKRFSKNDAIVKFKNGATITNLANAQSSKGRRRHRIKIEESALLNNTLYEDALAPIVEVPRTTAGSLALVDPEEMNFQIHFFTTSGYRGTDEFNRSVRMVNGMRNCNGDIVLGSSWKLPCYYGRGSNKSQILKKKRNSNPIFFAQNYEQEWVGCADNALVDVNKLMASRVLEEPILEAQKESDEYYIGVDVARSENTGNNQSAIVVIKALRNPVNKRICELQIVNVLGVTNKMNFKNQACVIKKLKNQYRAKMVIVDGNGLGSGLVDELLSDSYDPITGEYLGCFNTINTDNKPENPNADKCLFDMKAQGYQTKVVSYFINAVDSGLLKMLIRKQEQDFTDREREFYDKNVLPFVNTELLFMEIANLKLKVMSGNNLSVEKVVRKIDKDKFSALAYCIFYILEFCNQEKRRNTNIDLSQFASLNRKPQLYKR